MSTFFDEKAKRKKSPYNTEDTYEPYAAKPVTAETATANIIKKATAPTTVGGYDIGTNFMAESQKAESVGNFGTAKEMEYLHNQKIGELGLPYQTSHKYNYLDPYAGDVERARKKISEFEPFSYDYETDENYLAMKKLKEKEAQKAYDDGYAQMSRAFDGDIPVNMINKLLTTKNEIEDSADNYIPQLRALAHDMYREELGDLYKEYGIAADMAKEDYGRWSDELRMREEGILNSIAKSERDRAFEYGKERDAIEDLLRERQWNYNIASDVAAADAKNAQLEYDISKDAQKREDAIIDAALELFAKKRYPDIKTAYNAVKSLYAGAALPSSATAPKNQKTETKKSVETKSDTSEEYAGELYVDENGKIRIREKK